MAKINSTVLLVDALASGYSIESAAALAGLDIKEASAIAAQQAQVIGKREAEIREESKIMLPSHRWALLTKAASLGIGGYQVVTGNGIKINQAPALAIQAVKVANEMSGAATPGSEAVHITTVIEEMFVEMTKEGKSTDEAWVLIEAALPDYIGAVHQVKRSMARRGTEDDSQ